MIYVAVFFLAGLALLLALIADKTPAASDCPKQGFPADWRNRRDLP